MVTQRCHRDDHGYQDGTHGSRGYPIITPDHLWSTMDPPPRTHIAVQATYSGSRPMIRGLYTPVVTLRT